MVVSQRQLNKTKPGWTLRFGLQRLSRTCSYSMMETNARAFALTLLDIQIKSRGGHYVNTLLFAFCPVGYCRRQGLLWSVASITVGASSRPVDPVVVFFCSDPWHCLSSMLFHKLGYLWFLMYFSPTTLIHKNHRIVKNAYMTSGKCFYVQDKTIPKARVVFLKMARDERP